MEVFDSEKISVFKGNLKDFKISFFGISENYLSLSIENPKLLYHKKTNAPQVLYNFNKEKFYISFYKGKRIEYFNLVLSNSEQIQILKIAIRNLYDSYIESINKINEYNT